MLERLKRWLRPARPTAPQTEAALVAASIPPRPGSDGPSAGLVIDVRSDREFQATAIAHAVNIPLPQLGHSIGEIAPDKATPLVLYCASGARSGLACGMLKQLGYANVTNAGGLHAAAERLQRELRR